MSDSEEQTTSKRTRDRQKRKLADNEYTTDTDSSPDETSPKTPRLPDPDESDNADGASDDQNVSEHVPPDSQMSGFDSSNSDIQIMSVGEGMEGSSSGLSSQENEAHQEEPLPEIEAVFPEANDPEIAVVGPAHEEAEEEGDFPTDEEIEINSDGEEVEGNFFRADGERQFDPPLYRGSPITLGQSMMAILSFVVAHHCSGAALADLLGLIALHCIIEDNVCIKTLYKFKKYFENLRSPLKIHYFCSKCFSHLRRKDDICGNEGCDNQSEVSYFVEISIVSQLRQMFNRTGFYDKLNHRFDRRKKNAFNYEDVYDGQVYKHQVRDGFLADRNNVSFCWNSDGVRIFKSANYEVWPFYLVLNELSYAERFKKENIIVGGLWFGPTKPALPLFLNSFHSDLSALYQGIDVDVPGHNEQKRVRGLVLCGSCDMPAKAHFLEFIYFNGYYGCPKCKLRGERSERTEMNHAYPYAEAPLRTMEETKLYARLAAASNTVVYGIKRLSALSMYVPDYIVSTSIDIMHCGYQGVAKTLMKFWFDEEFAGYPFSLRAVAEGVDQMLLQITPPSYIRRLPRSLCDTLKLWKASEFKAWLFYYSIPVLSTIMTPEYFNHHLLLVHGLYLLNQTSISDAMIGEADRCLKEYVAKFQDLYGYKFLSINFHMLTHLAENVRQLGPLPSTSCMPFEDLNGQLKRLVHGTTHAVLQICSSLSQIVHLPVMIETLDHNNDVRLYCEAVLSKKRLPINEVISDAICTVGKYLHCRQVPPIVHNAFINANIVLPANVSQFFRLKKGRLVFYADSYGRTLKTMSSTARFVLENQSRFGIIQTFVRTSACDCGRVCRCRANYYAIVTSLNCVAPFHIVHPRLTLSYVLEATEGDPLAVPIDHLDTLCVCVKIRNKMFITNPVNTLEDE